MKTNFLTEAERKMPLEYCNNGFLFRSCVDLSEPVRITTPLRYAQEGLADAVALFIANFTIHTHPKLESFQGFSTIRFVILAEEDFVDVQRRHFFEEVKQGLITLALADKLPMDMYELSYDKVMGIETEEIE